MLWKTDKWFVSPFDFNEAFEDRSKFPKALAFHDSTLHAGEQQAGIFFKKGDKIRLAKALDRAKVDRIEVGTPGTSSEDSDAMKELVSCRLDAKLFSGCRNKISDIKEAKDCGSNGVTIRIEVPCPFAKSPGSDLDEKIRTAVANSEYAKSEGLYTVPMLTDATRSDLPTLKRFVQELAPVSDSIAIADSLGVATPRAISKLVENVMCWSDRPLEIRCFNDFGLSTANALAAVSAGASVIHTTVNGIGERSGETSLGEAALSGKLLLGIPENIVFNELYGLSQLVGDLSGFPVPPNRPIAGSNIFNIESAQSAQWLDEVKNGLPSPFSSDLVGHPPGEKILLSRKSGARNLELKLAQFGLEIDKSMYLVVLSEVYEKSSQKNGALTDNEFFEILQDLGLYRHGRGERRSDSNAVFV
jgi:isopropylmalate/homocitrate/citramalate synthase